MPDKRSLTAQEQALWSRLTKGVKPLEVEASADDLAGAFSTKRPSSRTRLQDYKTKLSEPDYAQTGMPARTRNAPPIANRRHEKQVRRGRLEADATLDLHGLTQAEAERALNNFILRQYEVGARRLIVVTGKGKAGEGVLKKRFLDWLHGAEIRSVISGYSEAHIRHGGGGAFYVFLKAAKR